MPPRRPPLGHLLVSYHTCPLEEPGTGLSGGMNVFLRGLLSGLAVHGIETDVLTRAAGDDVVVTRPFPGVRILHVPCGWTTPPTRESAFGALSRFVAASRDALAAFRKDYGVASAHYWMSGLAAAGCLRETAPPGGGPRRASPGGRTGRGRPGRRVPLVLVYHTLEARKEPSPGGGAGALSAARMKAEEALARGADRIVCFSGEDLADTETILPGAAGKGVVIPPGVAESFRRPPPRDDARRSLGVPRTAFLFLAAARPDPVKRTDDAVAAFAALRKGARREVLLLVAGQDTPAGGAPSGVRYAGSVPHARIPALYAAADAVLCTSSRESFGFVPLEAMAAGVPVVVPAGGAWGRTVLGKGGGIAYAPGCREGLFGAMRALLADPSLGVRLGVEGKRIAGAFTWERCTASWARLLRRLATPGSPR